MKKLYLILVVITTSITICKAQDQRLSVCKHDVMKLEDKVENLNELLLAQSSEVFKLKTEIVALRNKKQELEEQNTQLNDIAINMLNIALKFEQEEKFEEAMQIYKLLIKSYPRSLEATASRIQIKDLRNTDKKKS